MTALNTLTVNETRFVYSTQGVDDVRTKADALAKAQGGVAKSSDAAAASNASVEKSARGTADAYGRAGTSAADAAQKQAVLERAQRMVQASMMQAAAGVDAYDRSLSGMAEAQMRVAQAAAQASAQTVKAANDNAAAQEKSSGVYAAAVKFALEHPLYTAQGAALAAKALGGLATTAATSLGTASVATARYAADTLEAGSRVQAFGVLAAQGLGLASQTAVVAGAKLDGLSGEAQKAVVALTPFGGAFASMVRGLGSLGSVLPVFGAVALGLTAFAAVPVILNKAYDDLAKLIELGERAEKLDLGATLVKSFSDIGPAIRLSADEMQNALARASSFLQDRLGQPNQLVKALSDLEAGGFIGGSPLSTTKLAEAARTTEDRLRAALAAMAELEARGQRLAALDLADKVFGPAFVEKLRTGQTTVAQMISDLNRAQQKQLFTDADAKRALELSRAIEDTKRAINEALESTFNFSKLAMGLDAIWLGILKTVRDVVDASNKAADDAVNAATMRKYIQLQTIDNSADRMQGDLDYLKKTGDTFAADQLQADIEKTRESARGLRADFDTVTASRIDGFLDQVQPPARILTVQIEELAKEAQNVAGILPDVAGKLNLVGNAAAQAASQVASVAAGIRAIQNLNPNLSGALSFIDKAAQVEGAFQATRARAREDLEKTGNSADYEKQINDALTQRERTLKAINEQSTKGFTDYVKSGDLSKLSDVDRSLAQNADNFARARKEAEALFEVRERNAASPEDAARIRKDADVELAKIDGARKLLDAKARTDAAKKAASAAGSTSEGADAYDNAIARSRDQVKEFELQAQTAGKASEEVARLTEANRLRRAAATAGRSDEAGIAEAIEAQAAAYARARKASEDAQEAQRRFQEGQREMASEFGRFAEDVLLSGTKIGEAFSALAKSLSSNALRALISGEGPLAGILGTAPAERGGVGGLLGGQLNLGSLFGDSSSAAGSPLPGAQGPSLPSSGFSLSSLFQTRELRDAVSTGTSDGFLTALGPLLEPRRNAQGASQGFFSSPLGGTLAAAGTGAAIGYSSQSPVVGALGGALAGFAASGGNPVGALVGAAAGGLGGILGQSEAKAAAKKKLQQELQARREALEQARPQIETLALQFEGGSIGGLGKQLADAFSQMKAAAKTASDAGDRALADRLVRDYEIYAARMTAVFADSFNGVAAEMQAGFGVGGPFSQAAASVQQLGESLKGFLADSGRLGNPAAVEVARQAATEGALSQLDAPKTLSATRTELARIDGTAAGLNQVLKDLGFSAEQAAAIIRDRTNRALDALRDKFNDDLGRKINDATNKGYLNDAADLIREVASLGQDASAIGGDLGQVDTYFVAAAQKIVDGSQLVGGAFDELIAKFPELQGKVHEYSEASTQSAQQMAKAAAEALSQIQDRLRGYEDRAFAVNFSDDSLSTKLTAFDRSAEWEQWTEMAKGGQALDELIATQVLERNKLIADYNMAVRERKLTFQDRTFAATNDTSTLAGQLGAYDRQAQREREDEVKAGGDALVQLEQAQAAERLKIITDFGKQAADALEQQMQAARTAFEAFAKTIKTFVDAMRAGSSSPLAPRDRLAAAQSQYDAQLALAQGGDRTALDGITTYAQNLLDASRAYNASNSANQATFERVAAQLTALPTQVSAEQFIVDAITDSKTALVSATQAMQAALVAGIQANSPTLVAAALNANFARLDTSVNGLLDYNEFLAGVGPLATTAEQQAARAVFMAIDANGDGQISKLEAANASSYRVEQYTAATNNNVGANNDITANQSTILAQQSQILTSINGLNDAQLNTQNGLVTVNNNIVQGNGFIQQNTAYTNQLFGDQLRVLADIYNINVKELQNLQAANGRSGAAVIYATGGWVSGPGTGTSDSIAARVSNGEFIVTAAAAQRMALRYPGLLEGMNDNSFAMPAIAMPVPVVMGGGGGDLAAEMRALRTEVAGLRAENRALLQQQMRVAVAASEDNREGLDAVKGAVTDAGREQKLKAA